MQFGLLPAKGLRPRARYQGTLTASDYHGVNVLTLKYLRRVLPEDHLLLPSHCLQHAAGNTAAGLAQYLNIFTRVWTLSKTFAEGDFHQDLVNKFHSALEDEEHGLEIVDPDVFELGANDLGQAFTNTLLDTCYLQGLAPGEVGSEPGKDVQQVRDEFGKFFPCGWNRKRVLHPCPAGCCGPTPCHCRKTSLEKAKRLTARVILKRINNPAKNKWTKMHPAMAQATLIVCFFSIVQQALEAKTRVTYEELMAEGGPEEREEPQEGDGQAQDDQPSFKGLMKRFGKRCLAFVGDPTTKAFLLVWAVVGHVLMVMHFRFFKHCTFFSHFDPRSGERRISITDFCPGPGGEIKTNPASQALTDLAKLLFDPHGEGYVLAQPLMTMFGRTLDWTSQLVLVFQKSVLLAFCKVWRQMVHRFLCYPWRVACVFDPDQDVETREQCARTFSHAPDCEIDPWMGVPLRTNLATEVPELLSESLREFVWTMFERCCYHHIKSKRN